MVVHPSSHGISRVPRYSGYGYRSRVVAYGALTLCGRPSHAVQLTLKLDIAVHTPAAARNAAAIDNVQWTMDNEGVAACGNDYNHCQLSIVNC